MPVRSLRPHRTSAGFPVRRRGAPLQPPRTDAGGVVGVRGCGVRGPGRPRRRSAGQPPGPHPAPRPKLTDAPQLTTRREPRHARPPDQGRDRRRRHRRPRLPRRRRHDGRIAVIAEPGTVTEEARTAEDATGLVLAPGFVDPHTHYDAQLFWDPYATPSLNHGVTTVAGGNCGFTLAPLNPDRPEDADYTRRMMSKVEGMSLVALEEGAPWSWHTFGEYLDALEGRIAVNAGLHGGALRPAPACHGPGRGRRAAQRRAAAADARALPRRDGRRRLGPVHHPVVHPLRRRRKARRLPARRARRTARALPGRRATTRAPSSRRSSRAASTSSRDDEIDLFVRDERRRRTAR